MKNESFNFEKLLYSKLLIILNSKLFKKFSSLIQIEINEIM